MKEIPFFQKSQDGAILIKRHLDNLVEQKLVFMS